MRFRIFITSLLFPIWLLAQPGAFEGLTIHFRAYATSGEMILCGDKSYKIFPSFITKLSNQQIIKSVDTFHCENSRFEYTFKSSPMGSTIPEDFMINIIHGNDTMQVDDGLYIDSIPFRKGRFKFNTQSVSLYEVKKKNNAIVNNLNWELMEEGKKSEHPDISFLYEGGLIPLDFMGDITIEKPSAGNGLIAFSQIYSIPYSGNDMIWNCKNNAYWSEPYESSKLKFRQLITTAPAEFNISDVKFAPHISQVNKISWGEEPLLSFYILSEMHFINAQIAYMLLEGKIYKTMDAGNHWKQINTADKSAHKLYYNRNEVYAVFTTNEFAEIGANDSILRVKSFKTGKLKAEINSIQFQNDSISYFLINGGNRNQEHVLYKSINNVIIRKPLLRFLPPETKLIVTNKSVVLWFRKKSFWKSDDRGAKWTYYDNKNEYSSDPDYFDNPDYYQVFNVYADTDGVLRAVTMHNDVSLQYGKILLDAKPDSVEAVLASDKIRVIENKMKQAKDSAVYCNCVTYNSRIKNHRQVENGTYYRTELKFLIDRVPYITLKDGKFFYNPQSFYKEIHYPAEAIPGTSGTYVANENTITFTSKDGGVYLNGKFYYLFDGHNFHFYHCDKSKSQGDMGNFYNFDRDSVYHSPLINDTDMPVAKNHASGHIYSFTPDSEKFIIMLSDTSRRGIENASVKLDDIYATPMQQGYMYYFDKRTLKEFQPPPGNKLMLLISHPDYEPLVAEFSENTTKYVLKRKKKK